MDAASMHLPAAHIISGKGSMRQRFPNDTLHTRRHVGRPSLQVKLNAMTKAGKQGKTRLRLVWQRQMATQEHSNSHSIHCERVFQPMQGMERTSICTERSVWGSVRVSVLDTLVHSASGPKPPRAADALCGRHTRSSCNSLHLDSFPLNTGITLSSSQEMLKHTQ